MSGLKRKHSAQVLTWLDTGRRGHDAMVTNLILVDDLIKHLYLLKSNVYFFTSFSLAAVSDHQVSC